MEKERKATFEINGSDDTDGSDDTNGLENKTVTTIEIIDKLDDVIEGMCLAENLGISVDGLETLADIKRRLKCHRRLQTEGNLKLKCDQKLKALGIKDEKKRKMLSAMVKEVLNIFPSQHTAATVRRQVLMEDLLNKDGTTENIRNDCDVRIDSLKEKECVVLVSGESSAGKSSLLNLLLGEEILPSHSLPCTSCITVIKYSYCRSAKVLYKNGDVMNIPTLDKEGLETLQQRAYFSKAKKDHDQEDIYRQRQEGHEVAEIQVYLPLTMLSSGLVLVDTPGVGENEFLENYLIDYIRSHQILGFMYIIMTDNALGVAEDRLVNLMSLIIKSQKSSADVVKFNPKAALFVCNRWDMLPDESKKAVRENVLKQLTKSWPDFDSSSTVFFSTFQASREVDINEGYITEEYVALLHSLQKLVAVSLDKRIKASYGWLGTVLQRSLHYLRTMVRTLEMSDRERQQRSKEITSKLKVLDQKADSVVKTLYEGMEVAVEDIIHKIRNYLQTTQAKTKLLSNWGRREGELPNMEFACVTWEWVKRHIDQAFNDRLTDLLEDWDEQTEYIPNLEKKLSREAKINLCELENELAEIENVDKNEGDKLHRVSTTATLLTNLCHSIEDFESEDLIESHIPKKLAHRLKSFLTKTIKEKQGEIKLKDFKKDPKKVAEKKAKKLLHSMLKDEDQRLESFVRNFLQRPFNYIRRLENKIPNMISSNVTLQEKLKEEIQEQSKHRLYYQEMMVRIEKVRRDLIVYGEDNFCANDFQEADVTLLETRAITSPGHKILKKMTSMGDLMIKSGTRHFLSENPHGLWHEVHLGEISNGSEKRHVVVKIYSSQAKIENTLQEVAKLRCLFHNNVCIAEFLGIFQRKDHPTPALIFSGRLFSVSRYFKMEDEVDTTKMLLEVLTGLQYLHSKGLVHIELTKDTVTVTENGDVQLSGQCLPRKCNIPEKTPENGILDIVYLAPEVLQGHIYFACADMYSLALFVVEINYPKFHAFEEFRKNSVQEFLKISQKSFLEPTIMNLPFTSDIRDKLLCCLDKDVSQRPDAATLAAEFKKNDACNMKKRLASPKSIFKLSSYTRKK